MILKRRKNIRVALLYITGVKILYFFFYHILILYRALPAGTSHVFPENPSAQEHSAAPFASAHVPPLLHGLGLQAK